MEATVGALVVHPDGRVLIAKSYKWSNKYSVPGGHIELGERAEDAIRREVKEETGLDVEPIELLIVQQAIFPEDFYRRDHYVFLDYVCRALSTNVDLDRKELQEHMWIEPSKSLDLDLEPYTRRFIETYLGKQFK